MLIEKITPVSINMSKLLEDKREIKNILINGSIQARTIAEDVIKDIKKIIGLV